MTINPRQISLGLSVLYFLVWLWKLPLYARKLISSAEYREWLFARFSGKVPTPKGTGVVWFHGASIGEQRVLAPLIRGLQKQNHAHEIVLSTVGTSGLKFVKELHPDLLSFVVPHDFHWAIQRAFDTLQPKLIVLGELELWPCFLLEAKTRGIPVVVVNGRLSETEFHEFIAIREVHQEALQAIRWWGVQNETIARRVLHLTEGRVQPTITDSIKFDNLMAKRSELKREKLGYGPGSLILIAGSTHDPEEKHLLSLFSELKEKHPNLHLVLAPRFETRFGEVLELVEKSGWSHQKLSEELSSPKRARDILFVDQLGILPQLWAIADLAFIGGTFVKKVGGQNLVEPVLGTAPIVFGPCVANFSDIAEGLLNQSAAFQVADWHALQEKLSLLIENPQTGKTTAENARVYAQAHQGATEKNLQGIMQFL